MDIVQFLLSEGATPTIVNQDSLNMICAHSLEVCWTLIIFFVFTMLYRLWSSFLIVQLFLKYLSRVQKQLFQTGPYEGFYLLFKHEKCFVKNDFMAINKLFHKACASSQFGVASMLLEEGADIDSLTTIGIIKISKYRMYVGCEDNIDTFPRID